MSGAEEHAEFTDGVLDAIGAWQRGWLEVQSDRVILADRLRAACMPLPDKYRTVSAACYRKRFIDKGELVDLILRDHLAEGITSWTTDEAYAELFKGLVRPTAATAAIFKHIPEPGEVVLNIGELWKSLAFVMAAESYRSRNGAFTDALFNFRDRQGEVILHTPLKGSAIVSLVGLSSPFDELCDREGIPDEGRDELFRKMLKSGAKIAEPRYTPKGGAQRALKRTIDSFYKKLEQIKSGTST